MLTLEAVYYTVVRPEQHQRPRWQTIKAWKFHSVNHSMYVMKVSSGDDVLGKRFGAAAG
jgi:hypothetical protein